MEVQRRTTRLLVLAASSLLLACEAGEERGDEPLGGGGGAVSRGAARPAVVAAWPDGSELVRLGGQPPRPETEGPAPFAVGRRTTPAGTPVPVAGAEHALAVVALANGRIAWVRDRGGLGDLVLDDGRVARTTDTAVLPELAVSPDGSRLLYVRRTVCGCELVLAEPARGAREVVYAGPTADRPVFRGDGAAFAFFGTGDGGFASLFVGAPGARPRQVTNVGLRTGHGLPFGFVPPAWTADGMTFAAAAGGSAAGGKLRYQGPSGWCEVDAATGAVSCGGAP
jgi:hypothetical protein